MRVLVAFASKHGSTGEIAQPIAGTLRSSGFEVDCAEAGGVKSLEGYDAIVLGSAVYMRRWRSRAKRFLRRHGDRLAQLPFWVFSSGPVGSRRVRSTLPEGSRRAVERVEELGAREHVAFGGDYRPAAAVRRGRWRRASRQSIRTGATGTRSASGRPASRPSSGGAVSVEGGDADERLVRELGWSSWCLPPYQLVGRFCGAGSRRGHETHGGYARSGRRSPMARAVMRR